VRAGTHRRRAHDQIRQIHAELCGDPRVRRVWAELVVRGVRVARKRVWRLMQGAGLSGRHPRAWKKTTVAGQRPVDAPDLIGQDFTADQPNTRWCGDITCVHTVDGWVYTATVIDLHSRKVIGYAVADHLRTSLVIEALTAALLTADGHTGGRATFSAGLAATTRRRLYALAHFAVSPGRGRGTAAHPAHRDESSSPRAGRLGATHGRGCLGVYHLAQKLLAYQPVPELVYLAADRGMTAAQDADDPVAIAGSAWYLAHVFRESGQLDQADRVVKDAAQLLKPGLDGASTEHLAMWGSMQLATGLTAACSYDFGTAWRFWDLAEEIAEPLGPDYWHPWNGFGPVDLHVYAIQIDVALGRPGDAARRAEAIEVERIQSASERSRYLVEVSRGYLARRDDIAAVHLLKMAYEQSPESVKHGRFGRSVTRELLERNHPVVRSEMRTIAENIDLLV
jgi:hypothetical protein